MFELGGLSAGGVESALRSANRDGGTKAKPNKPSPVANALGSAAVMLVLLLWWIGVIRFGGMPLSDYQVLVGGVDYSEAVRATVNLIWWPFVGYAVTRICFDLFRAANTRRVRAIALGDGLLAAARAALAGWILLMSPVGLQLGATSFGDVVERLHVMFTQGRWSFDNVLVLILASILLEAVVRIAISVWRLLMGRPAATEGA